MAYKHIDDITIRNARIIWRNLEGRPDKYHQKGGFRSVTLVIEDENIANDLKKEGWNVKPFTKKEDDDSPQEYYLTLKAVYGNKSPRIYIVTKNSKRLLTEETCKMVDFAEISKVDITISGSPYENVNGRDGISAYIKVMFVTVVQDELDEEYDFDEDEFGEIPFN